MFDLSRQIDRLSFKFRYLLIVKQLIAAGTKQSYKMECCLVASTALVESVVHAMGMEVGT